MPSTVIHLCIAKNISEELNFTKSERLEFFLGSITPDYAQILWNDRSKTHFHKIKRKCGLDLTCFDKERFDKLYKDKLYNLFDKGVYVHLLADNCWNDFVSDNKFIIANKKGLLCSKTIKSGYEVGSQKIYDDYDRINFKLIDMYNLDLKEVLDFKLSENVNLKSNILEIDIKNIEAVLSSQKKHLKRTVAGETEIFKLEQINDYINIATKYCLEVLNKV
ncbi:MAG: hypothetical protein RSE00_01305 [Clostridia bacterium]